MEKGTTINVLDHGYVKYIDSLGTDESIIEAARMSTNKGFISWDKDYDLLSFLFRNHHHTPFEMCDLVIEVQLPIFCVREWHRHRTFSYNEMSARYIQMPNLHYVPDSSRIVKQSKSNKQSSADEKLDDEFVINYIESCKQEQDSIYCNYESNIQAGLVREIARVNTPVSRYTKMRAKANLRNWLHFLELRMASNAQYEIRQYANAVATIIQDLFPKTYSLFEEFVQGSIILSNTERAIIKMLLLQSGLNEEDYKKLLAKHGITDKQRISECVGRIFK